MTILVSGATGFMGSAITRHLLAEGHTVRAMSRSAPAAHTVFAATDMGRRRPILRIPKSIGKTQGAVMQHLPGQLLSPGAVDFVSQAGAVTDAGRHLLATRFPGFQTTPLCRGLAACLS